MITVVPVIIPHRTEVQCIIQNGMKFCETSQATPKETGIILLFICLWIGLIAYFMIKALDDERFPWEAIGFFIAPFILMVIFG